MNKSSFRVDIDVDPNNENVHVAKLIDETTNSVLFSLRIEKKVCQESAPQSSPSAVGVLS